MATGYMPVGRHGHSTVLLHGILYMWGGRQNGLPYGVHDTEYKRMYTSYVDTFTITTGIWSRRPTTGVPPLGVKGYSCTGVYDNICFFGGMCCHWPLEGICNGYHNSINILDTGTFQWNELSPTTDDRCVMKRADGGMISFTSNNEELAFIIGGSGYLPKAKQHYATYTTSASSPDYCTTNECNLFNVTTKEWSVPTISGQLPPPCYNFTLNQLPDNRGIMFGGFPLNNDVFIMDLTSNTVHFSKLNKPDNPSIYWPEGRWGHASAISEHAMVVIGGYPTCDGCIYNYNKHTWQQLVLPKSVATIRQNHSLSVYSVSQTCMLLVIFGGWDVGCTCTTFNDTAIIDLVYRNKQWTAEVIIENCGGTDQLQQNLLKLLTTRMRQSLTDDQLMDMVTSLNTMKRVSSSNNLTQMADSARFEDSIGSGIFLSPPPHQQPSLLPWTPLLPSPIPQQKRQQSIDSDKLTHILTEQLQKYCAILNKVLKKATLQSFANSAFSKGLITADLRDDPVYNDIEVQFTSSLSHFSEQEKFEESCKNFTHSLRSLGGPMKDISDLLSADWTKAAEKELDLTLKL